jgi:hypothetical protein
LDAVFALGQRMIRRGSFPSGNRIEAEEANAMCEYLMAMMPDDGSAQRTPARPNSCSGLRCALHVLSAFE